MSEVLDPELVIGAVLGLTAAAGFVLVPPLRTAWPAVLAAAAVLGLLGVDDAPLALLVVGVAVAAGGAFLPDPPLRLALAGGGAAITMAVVSDPVSTSTRIGLAVAAVAAGLAVTDLEARRGTTLVAVLGVGTLVGMFLTVPDTEPVVLVLAVVVPAAVLALRAPALGVGLGAPALLVVVLWAMAEGGRGRPGSIVGGVACLGVLVLEPAVHRLLGGDAHGPRDGVLVLVQAVVVVFAARVAGFEDDALAAAVLAAIVLLPAGLLLFATSRRTVS